MPRSWQQEPRLEYTGLSTLLFSFGAGSTCSSFNPCKKETALFNLYGIQDLQFLGAGVSLIDPTGNSLDAALATLAAAPAIPGFALVSTPGKFHSLGILLEWYLNTEGGAFFHTVIPIRSVRVEQTQFIDVSTATNVPPPLSAAWYTVFSHLPTVLSRYGVYASNLEWNDIGDLCILGGWTHSFIQTTYCDFVDITLQAGLLIPTGRRARARLLFDVPSGYNGHLGIPIIGDASVGLYEWLTIGFHFDCVPLIAGQQPLRIATSPITNGMITLNPTVAKVHLNPIGSVGVYLKADHLIKGMSFLFGYSFDCFGASRISATHQNQYNLAIANTSPTLASRHMHTFQFLFEYDFASNVDPSAPRIFLFYNQSMGGKQIIRNEQSGLGFGFDIPL